MKLQADTVNGVYEVDEFEEYVTHVTPSEFLGLLPTMEDGGVIACESRSYLFQYAIDEYYGIKRLPKEQTK